MDHINQLDCGLASVDRSDAFPILRKVNGVVIVGRMGRNCRDVAQRPHEIVAGLDPAILGVMAYDFTARGSGSFGEAGPRWPTRVAIFGSMLVDWID